jgi:hypothetical protein
MRTAFQWLLRGYKILDTWTPGVIRCETGCEHPDKPEKWGDN